MSRSFSGPVNELTAVFRLDSLLVTATCLNSSSAGFGLCVLAAFDLGVSHETKLCSREKMFVAILSSENQQITVSYPGHGTKNVT